MNSVTGKCLCEAVAYEIQGDLGPIFNCHCSKCRRWHGAAFRTRASIDRAQFKRLSGEANLSTYKSSENVTKYFCRTCGSPLISTYRDKSNVLGIPLGGLEGNISSGPEAHIFTGSKASWHTISDSLPQHEQWPGSESKVRETNAEGDTDAFKEIEALELELTSPEVRRNTNRLDQLLSDEFEEFGSSAAVIKKPDVLASLPNAAPATYELSDFALKKLSDGRILVTYRSLCGGRAAHRSSIWINYNGSWQILHHQATVISEGI